MQVQDMIQLQDHEEITKNTKELFEIIKDTYVISESIAKEIINRLKKGIDLEYRDGNGNHIVQLWLEKNFYIFDFFSHLRKVSSLKDIAAYCIKDKKINIDGLPQGILKENFKRLILRSFEGGEYTNLFFEKNNNSIVPVRRLIQHIREFPYTIKPISIDGSNIDMKEMLSKNSVLIKNLVLANDNYIENIIDYYPIHPYNYSDIYCLIANTYILKELIQNGFDIRKYPVISSYLQLMIIHKPEVAKLLIQGGCTVNHNNNFTLRSVLSGILLAKPIFVAIYAAQIEILKLLIEKGADINATIRFSNTGESVYYNDSCYTDISVLDYAIACGKESFFEHIGNTLLDEADMPNIGIENLDTECKEKYKEKNKEIVEFLSNKCAKTTQKIEEERKKPDANMHDPMSSNMADGLENYGKKV